MYVFLQEGRIIIFNEWLCICFVGKHDSLGQMSSRFLGLLGGQSAQIHASLGQLAPDSQEQYVFSQGRWVQNMVFWSK